MEKTFVFIKPDYVNLAHYILCELDALGNRILTTKVNSIPKKVIEEHYSPHKDKDFFKRMVDYFTGKGVIIAIYEGKDIIDKINKAIGPTNPAKAPEKTIRGKYSDDSFEKAGAEGRPVKNVIHRSDSPKEFDREIKVWERYLKPAAQSQLISCLINLREKRRNI